MRVSTCPLCVCARAEGCRLLRERLCELQVEYLHVPEGDGPAIPRLDDPTLGFSSVGDVSTALAHLDAHYRAPGAAALFYTAPEPSPNLGDADRTSWLTRLLGPLPAWRRMFPDR